MPGTLTNNEEVLGAWPSASATAMEENKNKLILLVDDEPDIVSLYKEALIQAGFRVSTALNGVEGLKLAREQSPNLILLDVKMPVMDGIEALEQMKLDPKLKDLKVVLLTALSDPTRPEIDIEAAKELGAIDFIKKGLSLTEFVERVQGYIADS